MFLAYFRAEWRLLLRVLRYCRRRLRMRELRATNLATSIFRDEADR